MTRPRTLLAASLVLGLAAVTGCARIDRSMEYASNAISWASWDHLKFSAQMVVRQPALATPDEAAVGARQGGWWGDEVPVASVPR